MLLLPVAFCTPMHKHEYDLNIEWGEGANVIMCYNMCDRDCGFKPFLIDITSSSGKFLLPVTFNLFISSWRACLSFFYTEVFMSSQRFFTFKIKKKLIVSYNWFWVLSLTMKSKKNCFSHRLLQINAGLSNKGLGDKNVVIIIVIRCLVLLLNLTCSTVFRSPVLTALTGRVISLQAVFLSLFVTELQNFDLRTTYNQIKIKLYILMGF